MVKPIIAFSILLALAGCAEIKPMEIPRYSPPDLSHVARPQIEPLVEGQDYVIDIENGRVCYSLSGQNKLTAKVVSERAAWQIVEMLKEIVNVQSEVIKQKDQLVIVIDLQRQYAERGKTYAEIKTIAAEIIGLILAALVIAK